MRISRILLAAGGIAAPATGLLLAPTAGAADITGIADDGTVLTGVADAAAQSPIAPVLPSLPAPIVPVGDILPANLLRTNTVVEMPETVVSTMPVAAAGPDPDSLKDTVALAQLASTPGNILGDLQQEYTGIVDSPEYQVWLNSPDNPFAPREGEGIDRAVAGLGALMDSVDQFPVETAQQIIAEAGGPLSFLNDPTEAAATVLAKIVGDEFVADLGTDGAAEALPGLFSLVADLIPALTETVPGVEDATTGTKIGLLPLIALALPLLFGGLTLGGLTLGGLTLGGLTLGALALAPLVLGALALAPVVLGGLTLGGLVLGGLTLGALALAPLLLGALALAPVVLGGLAIGALVLGALALAPVVLGGLTLGALALAPLLLGALLLAPLVLGGLALAPLLLGSAVAAPLALGAVQLPVIATTAGVLGLGGLLAGAVAALVAGAVLLGLPVLAGGGALGLLAVVGLGLAAAFMAFNGLFVDLFPAGQVSDFQVPVQGSWGANFLWSIGAELDALWRSTDLGALISGFTDPVNELVGRVNGMIQGLLGELPVFGFVAGSFGNPVVSFNPNDLGVFAVLAAALPGLSGEKTTVPTAGRKAQRTAVPTAAVPDYATGITDTRDRSLVDVTALVGA